MKIITNWFGTSERPYYVRLWLLFFIYPAVMALLVQLVILPHIFPAWNAGDGMLAGGDWSTFHRIAVELAEKIHNEGWSIWQLRPEGQAPSGIASIFYVLFLPKPWVLIPLNAALHASAALILFKIILLFTPKRWWIASIAILPFWLYPSAMIWYTQIHKDGYFILGFLLFVYGWLHCFQIDLPRKLRFSPISLLFMFFGIFFIWIVRPYALEILQGCAILVWLLTLTASIKRGLQKNLSWSLAATQIILLCLIVVIIQPKNIQSLFEGVTRKPVASDQEMMTLPIPNVDWQDTFWPSYIETRAYTLAETREGYRLGYPTAASNVDVGVSFHSVNDIIRYVPRATELAFLAPFPADWFGQGSLEQNTVMRRISGFEMIGIYISLALLPFAIWHWWRKPELWMVLVFCSGMMLIYALVIANIGTLYRFRYGFIMTLVALDIAGGISLWEEHRKQAKV